MRLSTSLPARVAALVLAVMPLAEAEQKPSLSPEQRKTGQALGKVIGATATLPFQGPSALSSVLLDGLNHPVIEQSGNDDAIQREINEDVTKKKYPETINEPQIFLPTQSPINEFDIPRIRQGLEEADKESKAKGIALSV